MERLGKTDKAVIKAFTERRAKDGHKLTTDGTRLDIYGLGGSDIAVWKGDKIHFPGTHGSRSGQLVERAVAREAPKNDLFNGRGYNPEDDSDPLLYVDPEIGYRVMDWHGGQGTALYALGSSSIAGKRVPQSIVEDAISNLYYLAKKAKKRADKAELRNLGHLLDEVAEGRHVEVYAGGRRNPGRRKNSHDPNKAARAFRAAVSRANEEITESATAGERGNSTAMLKHIIAAASWIGNATAQLQYADEVDPRAKSDYDGLAEGLPYWASTTVKYMREEMGIAANPPHLRGTRRR